MMAAPRPSLHTANLTLSRSRRWALANHRVHSRAQPQHRALSTTRAAGEENTYFPRTPRHQAGSPNAQAQPPIVVVQPDNAGGKHGSSARGGPNARRWPFFLLGFTSFPVFWLAGQAAYAMGLIPFTDPEGAFAAAQERDRRRFDPSAPGAAPRLSWDASERNASSAGSGAAAAGRDGAAGLLPGADTAVLVEAAYLARGTAETWERSAQRSDASAARTQTLLIDLLTSAPSPSPSPSPSHGAGLGTAHRAIRDDGLLAHPPVAYPEGAAFLADPARATLVRVVDGAGRNRALVLGVAPLGDARAESRTAAYDALEPVWTWLYAVGEELHHAGKNARGVDVPLYVWSREWLVENSVAAQGPNFLVVSAGDVPPGFPIQVMRRVKEVDAGPDGGDGGVGGGDRIRSDGLGIVLAGGGGGKAEDREG